MQQIAEELGEDANPEVVSRVAEFFSANSQFDKAVDLLIRNHQVEFNEWVIWVDIDDGFWCIVHVI